jgi:hypothetical protein
MKEVAETLEQIEARYNSTEDEPEALSTWSLVSFMRYSLPVMSCSSTRINVLLERVAYLIIWQIISV